MLESRISDVIYITEVQDGVLHASWSIHGTVQELGQRDQLVPFHKLSRICPLSNVQLDDSDWNELLGQILQAAVSSGLVSVITECPRCLMCRKELVITDHAFVCQDLCMRISPGWPSAQRYRQQFPGRFRTDDQG